MEEEEEVAQDLDLHHLILTGLTAEPVKSAEEVIQEIDDIMQVRNQTKAASTPGIICVPTILLLKLHTTLFLMIRSSNSRLVKKLVSEWCKLNTTLKICVLFHASSALRLIFVEALRS